MTTRLYNTWQMRYRKTSYSVYELKYHLVWVTKYRYPVLKGSAGVRTRDIIRQSCNHLDVQIMTGHVSAEHVHLLVSVPPTPDMIFYQGLAWEKLGQPVNAQTVFTRLVDYGQTHWNDKNEIDYFVVSLPDFLVLDEDLQKRNQIHCYYMMALGYLGLQDMETASKNIEQLLLLNRYHMGANLYTTSLRS